MSSTVGSTTPTRPSLDARPAGDVPEGSAAGPQRNNRLPLLLLAPATLLLLVVLGYPIVRMVTLSLQEAKLRNIVRGDTTWNNFENYQRIFADPTFWDVVLRTVLFAVACVAATMLLGTLVALLLKRLGTRMRLLVSVGLLMAWATPVVTATQVWQWLFDTQYGLVNWALVSLGFDGFLNYSWLANPLSLLTVAGVVVVWGAIPFVALTLYAGLTQVPEELYEAAEVDGATGWRRFWSITFPLLAPIFTILAALSTIWDFRVFTQVFILQKAGGITSETNLLGIYAYRTSFAGNDFGAGAAMSVVMVVLLGGLSLFYVRRMIKEVDA
jgi:N,N'-diacetylchitobiose transport system permease protein